MLPIPEGQKIIVCPYCDMRSLVRGERGLRRYQVPVTIQREEAHQALSKFLSGKFMIARGASRKSIIQETFIAYLPFWTNWSRVLGWVFGQEEVGSGDNKRYEPREMKITEDMVWNGAALDVGEFGVEKVALRAGQDMDPFNPEELHSSGMVFEPVSSTSEAKADAEKDFLTRVRDMANLDRVAQTFVRLTNKRMGLVYYPLWVLRYLYRGRSYQVVVDGHNSEVLYGKAPGSTMFRSIALIGGIALGAFIAVDGCSLATYLALASGDDDGLGILVIAGGALIFDFGMMAAAYRAFRYGEQYEYHGHRKKKRRFWTRKEDGIRRVREKNA